MQILLLPVFLTIFAASMVAQTAPAAPSPRPACDGNFATVRVSAIASAAHREWYRSHGQGDHEIFVALIVVRDETTRAQSYSGKEAMTYHVYPASSRPEPEHDAAYEAFVKLYRDNSDIKQQYNICLPKPGLR